MNKILLVAQRELLENVKTKGFWLGILLFPVLIGLGIAVPMLLDRNKEARTYAVVDRSGWLVAALDREASVADLGMVLGRLLEYHRAGGEDRDKIPEPLRLLTGLIADLPETALPAVAHALVVGADRAPGEPDPLDGLPPATADALRAQRAPILGWWNAATPAHVREIARRASRARFVRVEAPVGPDAERELARKVADEELFAYFVVGADPVQAGQGSKYVSNNLTDEDLPEWFGGLASGVVRARRLEDKGIAPDVAAWIQTPLAFEARKVGAGGEETGVEARDKLRQWGPMGFVYMLWIAVFSISQMLLTNMVEEKSNRIIEVLLSAVSPIQLMAGKILGIAATGLALVGTWALAFLVEMKYIPGLLGGSATELPLAALVRDPIFLTSFLIYFVLGYLLYAAILVGIGSVCNTLKDAQNLMQPVMLVLIIPLFSMMPITQDPNGTFARVMSFIPLFTPFVMMNRAAGPPAAWEYAATTVLLLLAIAGALWAAAKIFRIGILLTGKPPRLKEILRWVRAPVGMVPQHTQPT